MAKLIFILLSLAIVGCSNSYHYAPVRDATMETSSSSSSLLNHHAEHVVQPGETLYAIAWKYQRDYKELAAINNIPEPYTIQPGQTVLLQGEKQNNTSLIAQTEAVITYTEPPAQETSETLVSEPAAVPVQTNNTVEPLLVAAQEEPKSNPQALASNTAKESTQHSEPAAVTVSPSAGKSQWIWPAQGKVLKGFSSKNKGLDMQGNKGDPVYATAAGQVVYSGTGLRGYGQLVIIKHNADYLSAYAHNNKIVVNEGQQVNQGQQIAEIGDTGTNTTKLHFELRYKGKPVDPMKYLPAR